MSAEPAERLYTPEEIAQLCGLSRRAVYDAIKRGELGAFRLCSRLRISSEQLAAWLERNTVARPAPAPTPVHELPRSPRALERGSFRARLAARRTAEA